MALEIYNGSTLLYSLPRVLGASLVDKLSGERTLSFSSLISRSQGMRPGLTASWTDSITTLSVSAGKSQVVFQSPPQSVNTFPIYSMTRNTTS